MSSLHQSSPFIYSLPFLLLRSVHQKIFGGTLLSRSQSNSAKVIRLQVT